MTGPEMRSFCETVMNALPNIDWEFEGGGELLNMIATGSIYENFHVKIWFDSSRQFGCESHAEIRYGKSTIYRVADSNDSYNEGMLPGFACICIQEELAKISDAFRVASLTTKPKAVELTTAARERLVPYYGEREVFNHLTSLSFKTAAEFLQFIEANTDEQLKDICHYSLATISLMAIPCEVVPQLINIGCSNKVLGYVSRKPVEQWGYAPDKISQLTLEIPVEAVVEFFGRDDIRDELKQAQSELNFFPYAMPLSLYGESVKYLECINLDTFFRISSNRTSKYFTGEKIAEALDAQSRVKASVQKELSKKYGNLFPWDLPE